LFNNNDSTTLSTVDTIKKKKLEAMVWWLHKKHDMYLILP